MTGETVRILLVEDNPGDALLLREMLDEAGKEDEKFHVTHVDRMKLALPLMQREEFDLVLLDLQLPDSADGETISWASEMAESKTIVILTGVDDEATAMKALRTGVQDYLIKGQVTPWTLKRTIRHSIERRRLRFELQQARDELEGRVQERTAELEHALSALQEEFNDWRRAEGALRIVDEQFRLVAEAVSEAVWVADAELQQAVYVNAAYERIFGRPAGGMRDSARDWLEAVHPEDRRRVEEGFLSWVESRRRGGAKGGGDSFRIVQPSGRAVTIQLQLLAVRNVQGQMVRICGVSQEAPAHAVVRG